MIVRIQLGDEIADRYTVEAEERGRSIEQILIERLTAAGDLDPRNRFVILTWPYLGRVEDLLGHMQVLSPKDLHDKIERLARIRFGEHHLDLSAAQYDELARMAMKQSKPVGQLVKEAWTRFQSEFFNLLPSKVA